MRAVRLHGVGELRVEDVAPPGPPPAGYLRLKVRAAGICGSDLHNYRTGQWISRLPVTPGHEFAATVAELGADVDGFRPGDLVVADSRANCGTCFHCLEGNGNLCLAMGYVGEVCDGGFAEETLLPADRVLHVPAGVTPEIAALSEPLAVALHVRRRLDPAPDQPILIAGGGPIGGLVALLLAEEGLGPLLLIERNGRRAGLLAEVAGVEAVDPDPAAIARRCPPVGPRYAVEATGSFEMLQGLARSVSAGGRIALVGIFPGMGRLDANLVVERELDLRGCSVFRDEQADAVALLARLAPKLARLITTPIGLEEVPAAYERLIRGQATALKTIIRP
jgi:(R,R)-butanediol dehydrogenase / meso-butanediol dehydrogenase / diacetyl reductase